MEKIAIVGGGYTGLSAAYQAIQRGLIPVVYEKEKYTGGLAGTFEIKDGVRLEKFYHHWFTSDKDILTLISELGLDKKLRYNNSNTGLYYANSKFRLSTPWDLLSFTPISLISRIRTGLMVLWARAIKNWKKLEDVSAEEWIVKTAGREAWNVVWSPLMRGKFGIEAENVSAVWFWNKLKLRGGSRDSQGKECLVYLEGGFQTFEKALTRFIIANGGEIRTGEGVNRIRKGEGEEVLVTTSQGEAAYSKVLVTTPIPTFLSITEGLNEEYLREASRVRYLGNICLVLRLKRSLSSTYWLNIADPNFPFVGIIEHTNFDKPEGIGDEHIAYISKYLPVSDPLYSLSEKEYLNFCIPHIKAIFPEFSEEWIIESFIWKAEYSQPVITKCYSELIPPHQTPLKGVYLSTMAQIYPEDRGTNYAVREGRAVIDRIVGNG